ncbi:hypothetical protein POX_f08009 [Penicillium oxalicum]|uniref:hypothetical protein n=1 Tax=Penicillium oxalicum TaxID=69781 RepID=UPI0020B70B7D|nr:hypothetical protein POX_f08009 [Penicillium oxalicum]KAI2787636.1 hypothetical protein POX_f08009 [Penicillium oxalicum]
MGKSKNDQALTHEEIWDDSALVQSWDDAVEEYKLYHSIHAKGENVDDVLKAAEAAAIKEKEEENAVMVPDDGQIGEDDVDAMDAESGLIAGQTTLPATEQGHIRSSQQPSTSAPTGPSAAPGPTPPAGALPMPAGAFPNVQDEGLRNLMMAWYFAGYYTGLYEGQQQHDQSKSG